MRDFLGRTINLEDRVVYSKSTSSGGIEMSTHKVIGFTDKMLIVPVEKTFGRKVAYLKPTNCVVYKERKTDEQNISN